MSLETPRTNEEARELMIEELWKLEQLIPTAKGMLTILVDAEGGIKYFSIYGEGGKLPLLAGVTLGQSNLIARIDAGE